MGVTDTECRKIQTCSQETLMSGLEESPSKTEFVDHGPGYFMMKNWKRGVLGWDYGRGAKSIMAMTIEKTKV